MAWKTRGEVLKDIATTRTSEGGNIKTWGALTAAVGLVGGFLGYQHDELRVFSVGVGALVFGIGMTMVVWGWREIDKGTGLAHGVARAEELGILQKE
jgi:protein-S-isoprenylcysteine O-methyltransferase Ste14